MTTDGVFLVIYVYTSTDRVARRELWDYLVGLCCSVTMPWMVMGDLNSILDSYKKVGGAQVIASQFTNFQDCVVVAGLLNMRYTGNYFTWSNMQTQRINSKLDRVHVNAHLIESFPNFEAKFVNLGIMFDHSYIIIKAMNQLHTKRISFRFV